MSASIDAESNVPLLGEVEQESRLSSFNKTGTKIAIACLTGLSLIAVGAYSYPKSSAGSGSTTDLFFKGSNYARKTHANENSEEIKYLDRHNVDCNNDYLAGFKVSGSVQIDYHCMKMDKFNNGHNAVRDMYTSWSHGADEKVNFLDRQSVYCPADYLMNQYQLVTSGNNLRYHFKCGKRNWASLTCSNHATAWNTYESLVYLDRHNVKCDGDKAVAGFDIDSSSFREATGRAHGCTGGWIKKKVGWITVDWCNGWGWYDTYSHVPKIKYNYKCCGINPAAPTHAPIASPTLLPSAAPVATPTLNPTDVPLAHPTHEPVSYPTLAPRSEPTMSPTINTQALVCQVDFTQHASHYIKLLDEGCGIVSVDDISWSGFKGHSNGVVVCGSAEVPDLHRVNVRKGISYLYAAPRMIMTTWENAFYNGTATRFEHGSEQVVHHHNDIVNSIKFQSEAHDLGVPTECKFGTKVNMLKKVRIEDKGDEMVEPIANEHAALLGNDGK